MRLGRNTALVCNVLRSVAAAVMLICPAEGGKLRLVGFKKSKQNGFSGSDAMICHPEYKVAIKIDFTNFSKNLKLLECFEKFIRELGRWEQQ